MCITKLKISYIVKIVRMKTFSFQFNSSNLVHWIFSILNNILFISVKSVFIINCVKSHFTSFQIISDNHFRNIYFFFIKIFLYFPIITAEFIILKAVIILDHFLKKKIFFFLIHNSVFCVILAGSFSLNFMPRAIKLLALPSAY